MDPATLVVLTMQTTIAILGILMGIVLIFFPSHIINIETQWLDYMIKFRNKYFKSPDYKLWLRVAGMILISLGLLIISLTIIYLSRVILMPF